MESWGHEPQATLINVLYSLSVLLVLCPSIVCYMYMYSLGVLTVISFTAEKNYYLNLIWSDCSSPVAAELGEDEDSELCRHLGWLLLVVGPLFQWDTTLKELSFGNSIIS